MSTEHVKRFGKPVERVMELPDVPDCYARLVAGGPMALGRLAAQNEPKRGMDRLAEALSTI